MSARREVFLSGATGVLGSQLALQLLEQPDTKLWLLIRARSQAQLEQRTAELNTYLTAQGARDLQTRVRCVRGDAELERYGIDTEQYARMSRSLTHVVHAAGDVHFQRTLDEARRTAVAGISNAITLARDAERPRKLDYVSTVGVAGRRDGWIYEVPQPVDGTRYRNSYEHAKAEAELLLLAEMARGLPATIHRPTMIVGHSQTGQIKHPQAFYFMIDYFLGRKGDGIVPDCTSIPMDTVPVDYVARAIDRSLQRPQFTGEILHLSAGSAALRLGEVVARARAMLTLRGAQLPSISTLALEAHALHLADKCRQGSRFHQAISQFQPYFHDLIEFDNQRARALLEPEGITLPSVDSYLERVLSWHWAR